MSLLQKLGVAWLLFASAGSAQAGLVVEGGHVRASLPGVNSTSAYLSLRNAGTTELVLIAVSSPAAAKVTLHNTMNHDGMLHMMSMATLSIPAGSGVEFTTGAMHLMLEELTATLEVDNEVELRLLFANGEQQTIKLPVRSVLDE
jgi:periplasmic copper chaperone A